VVIEDLRNRPEPAVEWIACPGCGEEFAKGAWEDYVGRTKEKICRDCVRKREEQRALDEKLSSIPDIKNRAAGDA
jgi:hypothetical protein